LEDSRGIAKFAANPRVRITSGETLHNGTILDLVAAADRDGLDLLSWDGKEQSSIAPAFNCDGIVYGPPDLHATVREAMTFPKGAVEYGTVAELFMKVSNLYREYAGLPEDSAASTTCWTLSSWIPEFLLIPLTLCVSGAPMRQVCTLFRLFGSLSRRALLVAELSRHLPFFLHPTLMVIDSKLSGKARAFWGAANCHGMFVAGTRNTVCNLACSKAVLLRPEDSPDSWGEEAMHLVLAPTERPPLSDHLLTSIADEFQPWLEMFRLRLLTGIDQFASTSHPLSRFELARILGACIPEDPGVVQILTPLLQSREQDLLAQRSRDPRVAIQEAVWAPSHEREEMSVGEITKRVNAILRSRGVTYEFNVKEIGWKLRNLYLCTSSNGKCKVLRFSGEIRCRIHQCVQEFRLGLPFVKNCQDCQGLQATEKKPVE
jgi:hypothetical protein